MDQKTDKFDQAQWRDAMSAFASGVTIVACLGTDKRPWGMTVSAFCSLSMEPPMLLVCMNPDMPTYEHIVASGYFSVNLLSAGQEELSNRFAMAPDEERFIDLATTPANSGSPFINDSLVAIDCQLQEQLPGGDHIILLGRPQQIQFGSDNEPPLVYWQRAYRGVST